MSKIVNLMVIASSLIMFSCTNPSTGSTTNTTTNPVTSTSVTATPINPVASSAFGSIVPPTPDPVEYDTYGDAKITVGENIRLLACSIAIDSIKTDEQKKVSLDQYRALKAKAETDGTINQPDTMSKTTYELLNPSCKNYKL